MYEVTQEDGWFARSTKISMLLWSLLINVKFRNYSHGVVLNFLNDFRSDLNSLLAWRKIIKALKISKNCIKSLKLSSTGNLSLTPIKRRSAMKNLFKFLTKKLISSKVECTVVWRPNCRRYFIILIKDNVVQSEILMVVNTLLEDIIYDKFGYEVEDVERKIE
jgi:hypothetical protein